MKILFLGEPDDGISQSSHHARSLAAEGFSVIFQLANVDDSVAGEADLIHVITYGQRDNRLFRTLAGALAHGVPVVRFWTGPDVLWAQHHEPTRQLSLELAELGAGQYCRTPQMSLQLAEVGISAEVGPVVSENISSRWEPSPLPEQFTVLCRIPSGSREFFGGPIIDALIYEFPQIRFLILGERGANDSPEKNIEWLGMVDDMSRAIRRATVLVSARMDGALSRLMLETLSHGRHVISTCPWPHCTHASTASEFTEALRNLRRNPFFNLDGREAVCRDYDRRFAQAKLKQLLEGQAESFRQRAGGLTGLLTSAGAALRAGMTASRTYEIPNAEELSDDAPAFKALLCQVGEGCRVAGP